MQYDPQKHHRRSIRLKTRMGEKFFVHTSHFVFSLPKLCTFVQRKMFYLQRF